MEDRVPDISGREVGDTVAIENNIDKDRAEASGETAVDATTLRLLNLLFTLHVTPIPLSTEQIIGDVDMGYGSDNPESDRRKFLRDRAILESCGVFIKDVAVDGASMREESRWTIDRDLTHARTGIIEREDAEILLSAIDEHFSLHGDDPIRWPLQRARIKLSEMVNGAAPLASHQHHTAENTKLRHLWSAFERRRAARFTYRDIRGDTRAREVEIYAFFMQGSHSYLVGRCRESNRILTFRTDRITDTRRSPDSGKAYLIPPGFVVRDYHFLPFDFSSDNPVPAVFIFPKTVGPWEIEAITYGRGMIDKDERDGSWKWNIEIRDIDAAAAWALEHAHRGLRVQSPEILIDRIRKRIEQAVKTHGV